jgi:hypothetical protein
MGVESGGFLHVGLSGVLVVLVMNLDSVASET